MRSARRLGVNRGPLVECCCFGLNLSTVNSLGLFMKTLTLTKFLLNAAMILALVSSASDSCYGDSVSAADQEKRRQAMAASDHLIVPGERIGPIRLGMGMDQVLETLGRPDSTQTTRDSYHWHYSNLNMQLDFDLGAAPSVRQVETGAYRDKSIDTNTMGWSDLKPVTTVFHTDNVIQLGASSFDVKRAFSAYSYTDPGGLVMNYEHVGIRFGVTSDFRVWAISVGYPTRLFDGQH